MGIGKNRVKGVVIFIISLFVVMKLVGQENTYKELKDGVVYTRNAPFAILVETDKEIIITDTTICVSGSSVESYAPQLVKQFWEYYDNQTTEWDSAYHKGLDTFLFIDKRLQGKTCPTDNWYFIFPDINSSTQICKLKSHRAVGGGGTIDFYVMPFFLKQKSFPYEYILLENGKFYKIYPRIVLQKKKELNDNDVAVILNSIKKTYKHISSKIEFKFYGDYGGYINIPYVSSYTQDPMLQFKYLKNCIERGDEKIELELLYPQTFQFWTNLFIESGLFSSVYLKTDELILTNGEDGK